MKDSVDLHKEEKPPRRYVSTRALFCVPSTPREYQRRGQPIKLHSIFQLEGAGAFALHSRLVKRFRKDEFAGEVAKVMATEQMVLVDNRRDRAHSRHRHRRAHCCRFFQEA